MRVGHFRKSPPTTQDTGKNPGTASEKQKIIHVLNDRFGTEFEEADKLFFDQLESELMEDETLKTQARANPMDTFKFAFNDKFIDKLIGRMDQNQEIFEKILEDKLFGDLVKELMMKKVYERMNVVG